MSYINIFGAFSDLCSVLDGYSRFIVHRDLRESMTEADIEIILQGAKEKHPEARLRIISGNCPSIHRARLQRIHPHFGHDACENLGIYPQSNGKLERWHKSLKAECIRP